MEVIHCENCGFKLTEDDFSSGTAIYADDGRIYCNKCAPLFKFTTTALQKVLPPTDSIGTETTGEFSPQNVPQSVMKFFFCETCGKRITDRQIAQGQGRDKKLKGVYCTDCAVGVMTIEMDAIHIEQLGKAKPKTPLSVMPHQPESKPPIRKGSGIIHASEALQKHARSKEAPDIKKNRLPLLFGIGAVIVVFAAIAVSINHQSQPRRPVSQTERRPKLPPPLETTAPGPPVTKQSQIPSMKAVPEKNVPVATETPKPIPAEKTALPVPATKPAEHTGTRPVIAAKPAEPAATPSVPDDAKSTAVAAQPVAVAPVDKRGELFAPILKELAPILKQNHFAAAQELLDAKRRDPAFADVVELIDKEVADINCIQALRNRTMEALRGKVGTVVTLKKGAMTGTVKVDANRDGIVLSLKDGPDFTLSVSQLDNDDVCNLLPVANGQGKAEDLRRFGLLFLAAGETSKAQDYFTKARDAGPANLAAPYLERIAALKLEERESAALEAWKKAEGLFAAKNWKVARKAYETFQHDYAGSAALTANAELLKTHLEAVDEALGPLNAVSLDIGSGMKLELVLIPVGEFMMGSNDGETERPIHKVKITRAFYMGKYLVTQAQYEKVIGKNPSRIKGDDLPVEEVTFDGAEEFTKKLTRLIGKTTRLPSEAEWEYACRAGTKTKFHSGDNDAALGQVGWFSGNSENKPHPVGQKKPNPWGLYDMHGNVWEWCHDWMGTDYYSKSPVEDPDGPAQGSDKVFRGGSWSYAAADCRAARRGWTIPANGEGIGFRVVVEPSSKAK